MQFHLNGLKLGDPDVALALPEVQPGTGLDPLPDMVEVLILGCGPAGLTLAA